MKDTTKPASAQPPNRRSLLRWSWGVLGLVAAGEIYWIGTNVLEPRPRAELTPGQAGLFRAGPVDDFASPSVTSFAEEGFHLVRLEDGGFLALQRECSHLGCMAPWVESEQRFICPCHASSFNLYGEVLSPPAPRALDLVALHIVNDEVVVDLGVRMQRQGFTPCQVVYP